MALDIWYNFLYRKIDSEYAFDDSIRKNPMSRFLVRTCETPIDGIDQNAKIVSYYGDLFILNEYDDTTKEKVSSIEIHLANKGKVYSLEKEDITYKEGVYQYKIKKVHM